MNNDIAQLRNLYHRELAEYVTRIWPGFLVVCRVAERKARGGFSTAGWKPPLPHPLNSARMEFLLEPLLKKRMLDEGFEHVHTEVCDGLQVTWRQNTGPFAPKPKAPPVVNVGFCGPKILHGREREDCEALVRERARHHLDGGTLHWPEDYEDDDCPTIVLRWRWCSDRARIIVDVQDFEDALEDHEIAKRQRIAEANEY